MYICFQNESLPRNDKKMKIHSCIGSLNTIIMKLLEENGKMYGYEITQK
jgi:DNA-binding PadR family transcriptional regulator